MRRPAVPECLRDDAAKRRGHGALRGLIERIPFTNRHRVTDDGLQHRAVLPPHLPTSYARRCPPPSTRRLEPSRLNRAIHTFDREIQRLWDGYQLVAPVGGCPGSMSTVRLNVRTSAKIRQTNEVQIISRHLRATVLTSICGPWGPPRANRVHRPFNRVSLHTGLFLRPGQRYRGRVGKCSARGMLRWIHPYGRRYLRRRAQPPPSKE